MPVAKHSYREGVLLNGKNDLCPQKQHEHEQIVLNADFIVSATSNASSGGTHTSVRMVGEELHTVTESLGQLVLLAKQVS